MRGLTLLTLLAITAGEPASAGRQPNQPATSGDDYVMLALRNLEQHGNIAAKLRYESRLHDQQLVGQGFYWQRGNLSKRPTRWEMQTQIADQTASFVQVYDGDHLWTDRRLPSRRQVHRLDVAWLQAKLRSESRGTDLDARQLAVASVEGQGGLAQVLGDLLRNYEFQLPQPTQLNGLPVHALVGRWRREQLAQHWPAAASAAELDLAAWPEQLPHHVLLLLGNNLFPHVCEHRSVTDAALATSLSGLRPTTEPLVRYEIFDVRFAVAIPKEKFEFSPGEVEWTDETALVLERLTKGAEQEEVAQDEPAMVVREIR